MKSSHLIKTSENKDISKKPYLEVSTNYHKYNLSLMTGKSIQVPMTTRPRHSFSSFLSPNASTSLLKAKHNHAVSIIFPLGSESPGGIKTNTVNRNQSQALWNSQTLPIPPSQALQLFNHYLTPYEKEEILSFPNIYYIPIGTSKIKNKKNLDLGFDENNGDYKITLGDHLCYRYEILNLLGSGSFGRVVKALDHKEKTEVALKIIKNKPKFHEQASEEIEILNYLKVKDPDNSFNIVHLQDHFMFRSHICLAFELLGMNLYQTLKSNKFQGLPVGLIKKFSIQILQALSLLDRYKVIHCDLKPENILLNPLDSSLLKVIDFGSACFYDKRIYTYIQSRYYRAPEVILELSYSTSIDMWSFGCILVEMFTGKPAFPADTELELLHSMIEILGAPPSKVINKSSRRSEYFENDGRPKFVPYYKVKRKNPGSKSLRIILKGADEGFIDLVESCLQWDQVKRIEPDEALMHRWLQECSGEPKRFKHYKSQSDVYFKKFIPIKDANII